MQNYPSSMTSFYKNVHLLLSKEERFFFKNSLFLILLCLPFLSVGQFNDNFSDGDFSNNPTWLGNTENFAVTESELQLNDADASESTSQLYTSVLIADSTNWEFYVRLEFAPSTSNFAKVYLQSDNSDLTAALNGYFLKVGGISGSDDALELYRQTGSEETLLLSGTLGSVGSDPAEARVRVERDNAGNWTLWADYSDGNDLTLQGSAQDNTHPSGSYLGVVCKYTSSRKDLFFFDDFRVAPLFVDTTAPQLLAATPISSMEVDLKYDEPISITSILPSNFTINQGLTVVAADLDMDDPSLVHLVLSDNLQNGQDYTVTSTNISDLNGNIANVGEASFAYLELAEAETYDILINEFYADKSPQIGLPDAEFIELYNRTSDKNIDLKDWGIADATMNFVALPSFVLKPGAYVIICANEAASLYAAFGDVLAIASPPSLNDSGDEIILQDDLGQVIHQINYTKDWITDFDKQEGGWSYELKNPGSPCLGGENWDASENLGGGTPGQENTLFNFEADNTAPTLLSVLATSDHQLQVLFSENLESTSINFAIDNGIPVSNTAINGTRATLFLGDVLQVGTTYTLTVTDASDCLGNTVGSLSSSFLLPESPSAGDLAINEILFDPVSGGVDFVEIFNRSDKVINIRDLEISNRQNGQSAFVGQDYVIAPDSFVVFTENPSAIQATYRVPSPHALLSQDIPSFNNDAGNVTIAFEGQELDSYDYTEDQHFALLDDIEGVSLERLDPFGETNNENNWHSASSTVGFATPTYKNSQFFLSGNVQNSVFSLPSKTFSPLGGRDNEFLIIEYETLGAGYTSNVKIFDAQGRLVRNLVQGESLATQGFFQWDGVDDDGQKARMGIYVIWIEIFNSEGDTQHFKETCVLANKL